MDKMTIICDTNIWYQLGYGIKREPNKSNHDLIGTWINIIELCKTPNIIYRFTDVKNAVIALYKFHSMIIPDNPFDYIIKLDNPAYQSNTDDIETIIKAFERLMIINEKAEIDEGLKTEFYDIILNKVDDFQNIADDTNKIINNVRQNIKQFSNKKVHRALNTLTMTKDFINKLISVYTQGKISLSANFDWEQIDLFIFTLNSYFKELELHPSLKFNRNDWYDLFSLAYVKPAYRYWTFEAKTWQRLISTDKFYQQYLYNPQ